MSEPNIIFANIRNRFTQLNSSWRWHLTDYKNFDKYSDHKEYTFEEFLINIQKIITGKNCHDLRKEDNKPYVFNEKGQFVLDYRHIAPLQWWTSGDPNVIFLRLENLQEDWDRKIAPLLPEKWSNEPLTFQNKNNQLKSTPINATEIDLINQIYKEEIDLFDWSPNH